MSPRKNILFFYFFINFLQHDDNRQGGRPRLQFSGFVIRNESRSDVSFFSFFFFFFFLVLEGGVQEKWYQNQAAAGGCCAAAAAGDLDRWVRELPRRIDS